MGEILRQGTAAGKSAVHDNADLSARSSFIFWEGWQQRRVGGAQRGRVVRLQIGEPSSGFPLFPQSLGEYPPRSPLQVLFPVKIKENCSRWSSGSAPSSYGLHHVGARDQRRHGESRGGLDGLQHVGDSGDRGRRLRSRLLRNRAGDWGVKYEDSLHTLHYLVEMRRRVIRNS